MKPKQRTRNLPASVDETSIRRPTHRRVQYNDPRSLSQRGLRGSRAAAYRRLPPFLRALREEAGLTQRELGARLKKPQSWIYNFETANRRVDVAEFIAWARAYGVETEIAMSRFRGVK